MCKFHLCYTIDISINFFSSLECHPIVAIHYFHKLFIHLKKKKFVWFKDKNWFEFRKKNSFRLFLKVHKLTGAWIAQKKKEYYIGLLFKKSSIWRLISTNSLNIAQRDLLYASLLLDNTVSFCKSSLSLLLQTVRLGWAQGNKPKDKHKSSSSAQFIL